MGRLCGLACEQDPSVTTQGGHASCGVKISAFPEYSDCPAKRGAAVGASSKVGGQKAQYDQRRASQSDAAAQTWRVNGLRSPNPCGRQGAQDDLRQVPGRRATERHPHNGIDMRRLKGSPKKIHLIRSKLKIRA